MYPINVPIKDKTRTGFLPFLSDRAPIIGAPINCAKGYDAIRRPRIIALPETLKF